MVGINGSWRWGQMEATEEARSIRERQWEAREAARLIGIKLKRLQGWNDKGLLKPAFAATGRGSRRRYSTTDLVMGVILLAVQGAVGERSDLTRRLGGLRQIAERMAGAEVRTLPLGFVISPDEI